MPDAIVLLGHGSRDPRWRAPIEAVAQRLGQLAAGTPVRCAYLELTAPDLPTTAASLIASGATTVRVVPMFLGMGKHAREDLPRLIDGLRIAHPRIRFDLDPAVGEHPVLIDLLARMALRDLHDSDTS